MIITYIRGKYVCTMHVGYESYSGTGYSREGAMEEAIKLYEFFR